MNGIERFAFSACTVPAAKAISYFSRVGNCFTGGALWVWWADALHLARPNPLVAEVASSSPAPPPGRPRPPAR